MAARSGIVKDLLQKYDPHTWPIKGQVSHIFDKLYISDWSFAKNAQNIIEHGFDLVISIIPDMLDSSYYERLQLANIRHVQFLQVDCVSTKLGLTMQQAFKDMQCATKVLIHCHAGASRSAAVGLYWMCKKFGMSLENALQIMITNRPCVYPLANYLEEILQLLDQ